MRAAAKAVIMPICIELTARRLLFVERTEDFAALCTFTVGSKSGEAVAAMCGLGLDRVCCCKECRRSFPWRLLDLCCAGNFIQRHHDDVFRWNGIGLVGRIIGEFRGLWRAVRSGVPGI